MSPRLTFSRFSSVFGRVIRWLPLFLFSYSGFLFPFFFPLLVSQRAKCIYSFLVLYISPFFSQLAFLSNFQLSMYNFSFHFHTHKHYIHVYAFTPHAPPRTNEYMCLLAVLCMHYYKSTHNTRIQPACYLHTPHFLIFFSPPSHQKTIHNPLNSFI